MTDRDTIIRHLRTEIGALGSRLNPDNDLLNSLRAQLRAHESRTSDNRRTQVFRRAANDIVPDESIREFAVSDSVSAKDMGEALVAVSSRLDLKFAEVRALGEITERVNSGIFFGEVLDHVFENFEKIIPYDRIGVALLEENDKGQTLVRTQWSRGKYENLHIRKGYTVPLESSSLRSITESREPVIINNLEIHLDIHPDSRATRLLVKEGIRSNLTCPLMVQDKVTGFIFFSSLQPYIYMDTHIEVFSQIAGELARTLEKSRAYEDLCLRNEFIRKVFGQYVTNEVAEAVLSSDSALALGGDRRKVTVLMADLRGFTAMSEERTPEDVVDALNIYLGTMANVVMKYGGSVDNFIGDAIMAVFGAPITKPDDTARAIACAVEMQNSMDAVNTEIEGRGLSKLIMGIGVSTGEVIAGNIGSEARIKYSVIGSTVNLAARIEGITSGGQIFAAAATFEEIRDIASIAGHLNVKLKGLNQPVPIYEITGIGGDYGVYKSEQDSATT
jgi:class 3 adenylate cyclase